MLKTKTKIVRYYLTICGGLCRGKWINSYIKWKEQSNEENTVEF